MDDKQYSKEDKERLVSILSYFLVGIIWFFLDINIQKNNFVKFHVKQAIVLIIVSLIVSVIFDFFIFIPILGIILSYIASLLFFILGIIGIYNAALLKEKELPIIGTYASFLKF
jgi:uncharacterized membrane protein